MKQIWPLLSLVLIAMTLALPAPAVAALRPHDGVDDVVLMLAGNKKDSDNRDNSGSNRKRGNDRPDDDRPKPDRRPEPERQAPDRPARAPRPDGGGQLQNRDNRINRAMSVAERRGRVLDAGPQGGSVFWVRVATDHGRVDLLVDADSGRIIGER
jgi:hypothetical protein